jgi:hypothetical protein
MQGSVVANALKKLLKMPIASIFPAYVFTPDHG